MTKEQKYIVTDHWVEDLLLMIKEDRIQHLIKAINNLRDDPIHEANQMDYFDA